MRVLRFLWQRVLAFDRIGSRIPQLIQIWLLELFFVMPMAFFIGKVIDIRGALGVPGTGESVGGSPAAPWRLGSATTSLLGFTVAHHPRVWDVTLWRQCWLFMIGSALFALGTAPGFSAIAGATATNALCFAGSWFFTSAAFIQLVQSRSPASRSWADPSARADWLSAATQFVGTLLFNLSTGAALLAHRVLAQRRFVWLPDANGSVAFLASGVLAVVAVTVGIGTFELSSRDWQAAWVNMVGSLAFGVSAVGAFVHRSGATEDALLANAGTFFGALCFLAAAYLILPDRSAAAA